MTRVSHLVRPVPSIAVAIVAYFAAPGAAGAGQTIYVNFKGASLGGGGDDATGNQSQVCPGNYPAYGVPENEDAVLQAVMRDFASYDVSVTSERPEQGPFTMGMMGPGGSCASGAKGVAPMDCGNSNASNVAFAFFEGNENSPNVQAAFLAHELGHSFGLDHIQAVAEARGAIMTASIGGSDDPEFKDFCAPLESGPFCSSQHAAICGSGQQNAVGELRSVLGDRPADTTAPTVGIVAPADGDSVGGADALVVEVDAFDDREVYEITLWVDGEMAADDVAWPYELRPVDVAEGTHEIQVTAVDLAGNEGMSETIQIVVGAGGGSGGSGSGGDGDDSGGGESGDSSGGGDSGDGDNGSGGGEGSDAGGGDSAGSGGDGSESGGAVPGDETTGCACHSSAIGSRFSWIAILCFLHRGRRTTRSRRQCAAV